MTEAPAKPPLEFIQKRTFSEILNDTFRFFRENFKPLFKCMIFIGGPVVLFSSVFTGVFQTDVLEESMTFDEDFFARLGVTVFLYLLSTIVVMTVVFEYVHIQIHSKEKVVEIDDVWQATKRDFGAMFVLTIGILLLLTIALILFIIPGVYLWVATAFTYYIWLEERDGFLNALSRSVSLVTNHWWFTFGVFLFIAFLQMFIGYIFDLPSEILSLIIREVTLETAPALLKTLSFFTSVLAHLSVFLTPIGVVATVLQYYNLKESKEATTLMQKVDAIYNADAPHSESSLPGSDNN